MGRREARCPRTTPSTTSAPGPTARGATSGSTGSTWSSCTARPSVLSSDETYDALDTLVDEGAIAAYGVSVETCDQALTAIARRGTATVQIILNAFRLKPLDEVLPAAATKPAVGIIARVPLATGLLQRPLRPPTPPSPPTTTAPTTGTARPSTSARPSPASTSRPGCEAAREFSALVADAGDRGDPGPGRARVGRGSSPESPRSSPAPDPSSRLARTPPPASCRRWTPSSWPLSRRSTTVISGPRSTTAGDHTPMIHRARPGRTNEQLLC